MVNFDGQKAEIWLLELKYVTNSCGFVYDFRLST